MSLGIESLGVDPLGDVVSVSSTSPHSRLGLSGIGVRRVSFEPKGNVAGEYEELYRRENQALYEKAYLAAYEAQEPEPVTDPRIAQRRRAIAMLLENI